MVIESYQVIVNVGNYFINVVNWISVEGNVNLYYYKLQLEGVQVLQVNNMFVCQDCDSVYSVYGLDFGGKVVCNNLSIILLNFNIQINYYGVYLGNKQQYIDN